MKTLHLTNAWHASSGGIGTFYKALIEAANKERQLIRLIVPSESTRMEEVGEFGRIYHVQAPVAIFSPAYRMLYPQKFLLPNSVIEGILNDEKPDLVEICEKYTLNYLGGMLRTGRHPWIKFRPTVIGVSHERMDENFSAYISNSDLGQRFCRWYMKAIYFALFDHHVAVSEHTAAELIEASHGHKVDRGIWITPMGVDCDTFHRGRYSPAKRRELAARLGIGEDTTILVYVGRLAPEKNVFLLIDTMEKLPAGKYHLAIAGMGILEPEMRTACEKRGIGNVTFLGHLNDREELAEFYANADIFLHPNPREPFGIAPLEAMASGLSLVAPNCGGVISYANDTNAWLANANAEDFAQAVRNASECQDAEARRVAGRLTAEQHRWSAVTAHILELYRELHELTQGRAQSTTIPARAYSTKGDAWGRELTEQAIDRQLDRTVKRKEAHIEH